MSSRDDATDTTGCPNCVGSQQQQKVDRRTILRVGAAGSAMVVAMPFACGGAGGGSAPTGPIVAGNVSAISVGSLKVFDNAVLGRDAGGLYAMSAVCTHQGCPVDASGSAIAGLVCPCHGSRFDQNGAVTNGPAASPLLHYQVDLAASGAITIQGGVNVSTSTRTAVP